jgi:hypothetical protein
MSKKNCKNLKKDAWESSNLKDDELTHEKELDKTL